MKTLIRNIIIVISIIFINGCNMEKVEKIAGNPLFFNENEKIDFASITAEDVKEASDSVIKIMNDGLKVIYKIDSANRTFENSIKSFDRLYDKLNSIQSVIFLLAYVHPDSAIRNESQNALAVLSKYINEITLDENLYKVFTEYAETEEAKSINSSYKKLIKEQIDDFNRNGFKLPVEKRKELKVIKDKISDITIQFDANIREYNDFLIIPAEDTAGLTKDYLEMRKQDDGTYKIDLSYPSYRPFMKYAKNEENRKKLQYKFLNRAANKNLDALQQLLKERKAMADLLGYKTYANYTLEDKMAKTPEKVWEFENGLIDKVKEKAKMDYNELIEIKKKDKNENVENIYYWESGYYDNILLKEKYELDQEKLKEYFMLDNVLDGIFNIVQQLYGIKIKEVNNPSVWHPEVKMYKVVENKKTIGIFYLDLFPRDNKYNHAACFSMVNGVNNDILQQIPLAALVCNFPRPTKEKPSLITHSDVITTFHEFGHLMHHLLAVTSLSMQSGISNSRDFVEVPSQFFENWAWSYESLKLFAKHYKTGQPLPKELHEKMIASRNVGSGLASIQQIFYGLIDMTYHDMFDPDGEISTTDVVKKLQNEITLFPYTENTHFQAAFSHLTSYAAGYYGYLWAKVYAEDCFSLFEKERIMDQEIGLRFRNEILAQGSSKDEMEIIKAFLQREPNDKAFIKSLGL